MKKILFLTKSYPDFRRSATVLCTHRVMEAVAKDSKYEVHCLCQQYQNESSSDFINGIYVHRFPISFFESLKYRYSVCSSKKEKRINRFLTVFQKTLTIPFYPYTSPLSYFYWKKYAIKLQKKENFDCIIAEHYGINTLSTGLCIKKLFPETKFIPILWDPIAGQVITEKLPVSFTSSRVNRIESLISNYADKIVSTVAMKRYYSNHEDLAQEKRVYLDIPSVIEPEPYKPTEFINLLDKQKINIVFSGYIDSHRDPNPVIELLNNSSFSSNLNVLFFCKGVKLEDIEKWKTKFNGSILFHEYIPLTDLHMIYRDADYLLNISSINPDLIPSKIFEFMSYGKPIISFYKTESDSAKSYLDRYNDACVVDLKNNMDTNLNQIEAFLKREHNDVLFHEVEHLFPDNSPRAFLSILDAFLN